MKTQGCDPKTIGERLVKLRGIRTRVGAAREMGLNPGTLAFFERGQRLPSYGAMVRIADYYGATVQEIFFDGG